MSKDLDGIQKRMSELEQELLHLKKELAEKESSQPAEQVDVTERGEQADLSEPVKAVEAIEIVGQEEPSETVDTMQTAPSVPLETKEEGIEPFSEEIHKETTDQHQLEDLIEVPPQSVSSTEIQTPEILSKSQALPAEKTVKADFNLERMLGLWLPRVFMFILLLGVLWGLKVAFDNGWITDWVRILLGYAGTALLYYAGMRNIKNSRAPFGLTLLGGFIALGILTTFAAHHLYGYFPYILAFLIAVAYIVADQT